ncbi:MAG: AAA family ATPase [Betaproteobacteria bacterium]|nr:AAA family ATPase [Betaproteobacteria bacterium]
MYLSYFGLAEAPFSIAPNPRYLYMSARHKEALAHLLYGLGGSGGFVLLTGEIGAGKTTLARRFLEQVPSNCRVAYVLNPKLTALELLSTICDEFHITYARSTASVKTLVDAINTYLLTEHANGRNCMLVVDEAQNLSVEVMEQLRLLTNLETAERKLLQITLIGQPELRTMLAQPELKQMEQRVVARYHLDSLSAEDTAHYLAHRLVIAGGQGSLFNKGAVAAIHAWTHGVPRRINVLADRALLGAYAQGKRFVDETLVHQAAEEVFDAANNPRRAWRRWGWAAAAVLGVGVVAALATGHLPGRQADAPHQAAARSTAPTDAARSSADPVARGTVAVADGSSSMAPPTTAVQSSAAAPTLPAPAVAVAPAATRALAASPTTAPATAIDWAVLGPQSDGRDAAWRALFAAWSVPYTAGPDPCRQAADLGLACMDGSAGLDLLARYNHPVLLRLDRDGKPAYATLLGLGGGVAVLRVGDVTQRVESQALAQAWTGSYTLLWRAPPIKPLVVQAGQRGTAVAQLTHQLQQARAWPPGVAASDVYDAGVQRAVRAFQIVNGLQPDGIAGPQTLLVLNGLVPGADPTLQRQQAGR